MFFNSEQPKRYNFWSCQKVCDALNDLLNIDNPYFEQIVRQIYSTELQLNKANSFDIEVPFLDLVVHNEWHSFI